MNVEKYFKSLTSEMEGLKNRIRDLIEDAHWLTDGEWKESVLRTFLTRNLPDSIRVGRGFVLTNDGPTTQIDILIYKATSPVFFRDGDLVFIPSEAVLGVIEVKSKLDHKNFSSSFEKLAAIGNKIYKSSSEIRLEDNLIRSYNNNSFLLGLFAYESEYDNDSVLQKLSEINNDTYQVINLVSHGDSNFVKYWETHPKYQISLGHLWHSYVLNKMAAGYFIHNVLLHISPDIISTNEKLWFPADSKEIHKDGEMRSIHPNEKFWDKFL